MFASLTRRKRAKAGWLVALLYLFCVIAPGLALALGDAASCLPMPAAQSATHAHDHSGHGPSRGHGDIHPADADDAKHQHHGKNALGPCCAMLCVSGIAAELPFAAKPVLPKSAQIAEKFLRLPDKAPPRLYRPPIA